MLHHLGHNEGQTLLHYWHCITVANFATFLTHLVTRFITSHYFTQWALQ